MPRCARTARRSTVFISGDPATVDALTRAAALFDVDWLRGRSFQFYPLRYASAAAVTDDVEKVLGGTEGPIGTAGSS